jgi:hypothetical protein
MEGIEHDEHALQKEEIEPHICWSDQWKILVHGCLILMRVDCFVFPILSSNYTVEQVFR